MKGKMNYKPFSLGILTGCFLTIAGFFIGLTLGYTIGFVK